MKIVVYLTIIVLILSLVESKRSKGKSKKGILVGRLSGTPQGPGSAVLMPRPVAVSRPLVVPRPVVRSSECPDTHNFHDLVDSQIGHCEEPCTIRTCIQTSERCCYYTAAMRRRRILLKK